MPQRPRTPEIGSFNVTADPRTDLPLPVMSPNPTPVPVFSSGGEDAIRKFMGEGPVGQSGSMYDPFANSSVGKEEAQLSGGPVPSLAEQIDSLHAQVDTLAKQPDVTYTDRLKKHDISIDRAREIVDAILFKGEYHEEYKITQKHSVVFKSRMFSDQERALRALEQISPQYPASMAAIVSKNNLASSIVRFAGRDFTKMAFKDKAEYIEKLPEPLVRLLAIKLGKFDQMIMDIMDDGVIENF